MFTPQRKVWSGWSLTPQKNNGDSNHRTPGGTASKGKGVAYIDGPPPPLGSLGENGRDVDENNDGDKEVWMKFREAGLLDEASLELKDRQALLERVAKLEKELYDYQYNMGLLLLEKKEWIPKHEELRQALAESQELLNREQVSHLNALSEVEKREENLRKALGVEKQCVTDLERALHEMRAECAQTKYTADTKMAEAEDLASRIEGKSLEVEAKLRATDVTLAEANRKHADAERKLKEAEIRESSLRSERQSLSAEREMNETALSKQREELRDWEKMLNEREERLIEGRKVLNQREERANETDMIIKQKEKDLEIAQKKIENTNATLAKKEDDIDTRLAKVAAKEREVDAIKHKVEVKEKELIALEEKLNVRERVEIQKVVDEHNAIMELKKHEFEMEMDRKRKSLDEELKNKSTTVDQKEIEINHKEEKIIKREQALEKKIEKNKEREKDLESKSKALRDREKSIKAEEKNLEIQKKAIFADKESLEALIPTLEKQRADLKKEELRLCEEKEKLKLTEEERSEHNRLKSELKQEIDKCKAEEELLLKEHENLKQDRENFEREWEVLDEKRVEITRDLKQLNEEKESFKKFKHSEEERLKNEKVDMQNHVKKELDDLRLQKELFEAIMKQEKSVISENAQSEREDMLREFELRKRELEVDMQNRRDEVEKQLRERERAFEELKERDSAEIKSLREAAAREMEDSRLERLGIEKEKEKVVIDRRHLEGQQLDMQRDIENLCNLVKKLKDRREQFKKFVEKHKSCKNCGEVVGDFILSNLQYLQEMEDSEAIPSASLAAFERPSTVDVSPVRVGSGAGTSGGGMSWFRKCTSKIINLSPLKRSNDGVAQGLEEESYLPAVQVDVETSERLLESEHAPEAPIEVASDWFDVERIQAGDGVKEVESQHMESYENYNNDQAPVPEDSQQSELKTSRAKAPKKRTAGGRRTRSARTDGVDAEVGISQEQKEDDRQPNGAAENSAVEESRDDSQATRTTGHKRSHAHTSKSTASEQGLDDTDTRSDSVTAGGRRKRRQTVAPGLQTPGERRYNLRRPKTVGRAAVRSSEAKAKDASEVSKQKEKDATTEVGKTTEEEVSKSALPAGVQSVDSGSTHAEQVTKLKTTVTEVYEFSSDRIVMVEPSVENIDGNGDAANLIESMETSDDVNGTAGGGTVDEDGYGSEIHGDAVHADEDDEEYEEDEESEHPGEASVGKKIWHFFTS